VLPASRRPRRPPRNQPCRSAFPACKSPRWQLGRTPASPRPRSCILRSSRRCSCRRCRFHRCPWRPGPRRHCRLPTCWFSCRPPRRSSGTPPCNVPFHRLLGAGRTGARWRWHRCRPHRWCCPTFRHSCRRRSMCNPEPRHRLPRRTHPRSLRCTSAFHVDRSPCPQADHRAGYRHRRRDIPRSAFRCRRHHRRGGRTNPWWRVECCRTPTCRRHTLPPPPRSCRARPCSGRPCTAGSLRRHTRWDRPDHRRLRRPSRSRRARLPRSRQSLPRSRRRSPKRSR
jgi:hypothetical protein